MSVPEYLIAGLAAAVAIVVVVAVVRFIGKPPSSPR
jgi:hypothetical protein